MTPPDGKGSGLFGGLADAAERFLGARIERLAKVAQEHGDALADSVGERLSHHLVEQLSARLAARLAWAAVAVGALIVAVTLLAVGLAGALGEAFGRPWLGQLAAGAITLVAVLGTGFVVRARRRAGVAPGAGPQRVAPASAAAAATAPDEDDEEEDDSKAAPDAADTPGGQALKVGADLLRRHPVAGAAVIGLAALVAGKLLARQDARAEPEE